MEPNQNFNPLFDEGQTLRRHRRTPHSLGNAEKHKQNRVDLHTSSPNLPHHGAHRGHAHHAHTKSPTHHEDRKDISATGHYGVSVPSAGHAVPLPQATAAPDDMLSTDDFFSQPIEEGIAARAAHNTRPPAGGKDVFLTDNTAEIERKMFASQPQAQEYRLEDAFDAAYKDMAKDSVFAVQSAPSLQQPNHPPPATDDEFDF